MYTTYVAISGSISDVGVKTFGTNIVSEQGVLIHQSRNFYNPVRMVNISDGTSNTLMVGEQGNHLRDAKNNIILGATYGGATNIAVTCQGPDGWIQGCPLTIPNKAGNNDVVYNSATIRYPLNQIGPTQPTNSNSTSRPSDVKRASRTF
jgi:hypothetical protein